MIQVDGDFSRAAGSTGDGVLVDSSLWVDFLCPNPLRAIRKAVSEALAQDRVFTNTLILAEVVQGAPDEETLETLVGTFAALHQVELGAEVGAMAARIGFALRRQGHPIPPTDLVIAATAIHTGCELWHRDVHFELVEKVAPLSTRKF